MGPLPFATVGAGPPAVVLAGLTPTTGFDGRWSVLLTLGPMTSLADRRRLVAFNRRPGLPRGSTMATIAAEHADALRAGLGAPVDVIGLSTGGSIAQQLAADHPDVVRRLVLVSTACRLSAVGRADQRRVAARIRAGAQRQALALVCSDLVPTRTGRLSAAAIGWLLGPALVGNHRDLDDMATTIEAEDTFDLARCARPVSAPTLILAGGDDRFYPPALLRETAELIADSELRVFPGRGHVTVMSDRGFLPALTRFLE